jgi:hypothetical protein
VTNSLTNTIKLNFRKRSKEKRKEPKSLVIAVGNCQRTIRRVQDEETQRIINEEAERRLLAAYIHGLNGIVGQQVQFQICPVRWNRP